MTTRTQEAVRSPDGAKHVNSTEESAGAQAKRAAYDVASQARERIESKVEANKARVAGWAETFTDALRQTGRLMRRHETTTGAELVDRLAEQLEQATRYVQNRSVAEMGADVEQFARRRPAFALGGAFVMGLMAARFIKSSSRPRE